MCFYFLKKCKYVPLIGNKDSKMTFHFSLWASGNLTPTHGSARYRRVSLNVLLFRMLVIPFPGPICALIQLHTVPGSYVSF